MDLSLWTQIYHFKNVFHRYQRILFSVDKDHRHFQFMKLLDITGNSAFSVAGASLKVLHSLARIFFLTYLLDFIYQLICDLSFASDKAVLKHILGQPFIFSQKLILP